MYLTIGLKENTVLHSLLKPAFKLERFMRRKSVDEWFRVVDRLMLKALVQKPDGAFDHLVRDAKNFYQAYTLDSPVWICRDYFMTFFEDYVIYTTGNLINPERLR